MGTGRSETRLSEGRLSISGDGDCQIQSAVIKRVIDSGSVGYTNAKPQLDLSLALRLLRTQK